jgi:hypothetical protein
MTTLLNYLEINAFEPVYRCSWNLKMGPQIFVLLDTSSSHLISFKCHISWQPKYIYETDFTWEKFM